MADLQKKLTILPDNPLCGISTYKDTLNLANGSCTRIIGKYEFTGQENWVRTNAGYFYTGNAFSDYNNTQTLYQKLSSMFSHYIATMNDTNGNSLSNGYACLYCSNSSPNNYHEVYIRDNGYSTANDFKAYLAQQYANGTPVTIWYVLAESTTETITVPSGLSGTEEGYLTQSGTPTPTNPIYPTANNVEVWQHSLRKLTTATDTITTLPADLYADGNNATVGLVGNMQQSGTPTPDNPITPSGCGERTANLLNANSYYASYKSGNSYTATTSQFNTTIISPFTTSDIGKTYTISCDITEISSTNVRWLATINGVSVNGDGRSNTGQIKLTFTVETENDSFKITYGSGNYTLTIANVMMNEGSTTLPYQPYGYKLDIKSANTTTPVYLGKVESTRKIMKLVLTGQEDWRGLSADTTKHYLTTVTPDYLRADSQVTYVSSHYGAYEQTTSATLVPNGKVSMASNTTAQRLYIADATYTNNDAWKAYLAQQYANGTPVTIWYVLATETTGIVNEPIRKIGNYADTVSGVSIPTITGKDSFDVLTTLKPSEVSLAYTGWHDATVREKSRNLFDAMAVSKGRINSSTGAIEYAEDTPTLTYSDTNNEFTITTRYAWRGFITEYLDLQEKPAFSYISDDGTFYAFFYAYDANKNYLGAITSSVPTDTKYIRVSIQCSTVVTNAKIKNIMLNTGSTALPYEPYWK